MKNVKKIFFNSKNNRVARFIVFLIFFTSETNFAFFNAQLMRRRMVVSLEVPIELIDTGIASTTSSKIFENSRTSLDTGDYDGSTVTYSFEIVALSTDTVARTVTLVDTSGTTVASISVPTTANSSSYTRLRTTFTPTSGANNYRVQMPAATSAYDISVMTARILVTQVNATKTKLYYPLLSDNTPTNINTSEVDVDNKSSTAWSITSATSIIWLKDNNNLASIASGSSWTLEAVVAAASSTAQVALAQNGTTTVVTGSTATTTSTTPTLLSASFANNATNFTDNSEFQVKISNTTGATTYIYKAGIWVKLTNLSKGVVQYRVGRYKEINSGSTAYRDQSRVYIDTTVFKKPKFYYEDVGQCSVASCATTGLYDNGTNDKGTTSPTLVTSSSNTPGTSFARTRGSQISLTSGDRFYGGYTYSSGTYKNVTGFLVVTFSN